MDDVEWKIAGQLLSTLKVDHRGLIGKEMIPSDL
jgi:uncharacterized membrane protein YdcZ (DUF606 family)